MITIFVWIIITRTNNNKSLPLFKKEKSLIHLYNYINKTFCLNIMVSNQQHHYHYHATNYSHLLPLPINTNYMEYTSLMSVISSYNTTPN